MTINLQNGKYKSTLFPFEFFDDDSEWEAYKKEFPDIVATAIDDPEKRFTGSSTEVFKKAVEYIPRSMIGRKYQYWIVHRLLTLMIEENKGKILDYGCGAGNMGMMFAHTGFSVDFSEVEGVITDFLKWRVSKHFLRSRILTHEQDLGENQYDLVIMQNVIEHLDNPLEVLQKVIRSIKVGGYFFMTCYTTGKGLDVVNAETLNKVLMPLILNNFIEIEGADNMLYRKR